MTSACNDGITLEMCRSVAMTEKAPRPPKQPSITTASKPRLGAAVLNLCRLPGSCRHKVSKSHIKCHCTRDVMGLSSKTMGVCLSAGKQARAEAAEASP